MPSIEVTAEQAAALARGENITIEAPKPEPTLSVVVTYEGGTVWLYEGCTQEGLSMDGKPRFRVKYLTRVVRGDRAPDPRWDERHPATYGDEVYSVPHNGDWAVVTP